MLRTLLLASVLTFLLPFIPSVRPQWKESGWISTCAGAGCMGRRSACLIYYYNDSQGDRVNNWCYWD
jgi:hypothetical protein